MSSGPTCSPALYYFVNHGKWSLRSKFEDQTSLAAVFMCRVYPIIQLSQNSEHYISHYFIAMGLCTIFFWSDPWWTIMYLLETGRQGANGPCRESHWSVWHLPACQHNALVFLSGFSYALVGCLRLFHMIILVPKVEAGGLETQANMIFCPSNFTNILLTTYVKWPIYTHKQRFFHYWKQFMNYTAKAYFNINCDYDFQVPFFCYLWNNMGDFPWKYIFNLEIAFWKLSPVVVC